MAKQKKMVSAALSMEDAIEVLLSQAKKLGADQADILGVETTNIAVAVRHGKIETLERSESLGIGLRVLIGQRQAMVSMSDLLPTSLQTSIEQAVNMASLAPEDPYVTIADSSMWIKDGAIPQLDLYDKSERSVTQLTELARQTEDIAMAVKGITNSEGADASQGKSRVWLANSHGFFQHYQTSMSSFSVSVIAEENGMMERDYDYTMARYASDLKTPEEIADNAAKRTLARLGAKPVKTCSVPIVFEPRIARNMVGIFISAINGASIARGTSFLKDSLHQQVFIPGVQITNDPHKVRGLGSKPFDAEALPCQKLNLLDSKGCLTSWLLDLRSAKQLGMKSTGNASRGLGSAPSPSAHNVYMQAGNVSVEDLLASIKQGFYVTETFGSGVNLVTGDYSQGASGFWIEGGKITHPVNEVTIAGNLKQMFLQVTPADDLVHEFTINAPTIKIEGMTVAGQ